MQSFTFQPYFCGQHDECRVVGSEWALSKAKANVERWYPVVGVLEMFRETLEVLEKRLPRFFRGVANLYYGELSGVKPIVRAISLIAVFNASDLTQSLTGIAAAAGRPSFRSLQPNP